MHGPFDDQTVSQVADTLGVRESDLAESARSVQAAIADYPGVSVDGLIYRRCRLSASGLKSGVKAVRSAKRVPYAQYTA